MTANPPILSYSNQADPPWFARQLLRPIGWLYFSLAGAGLLWSFWELRVPNPFGPAIMTVVIGLIFWAVALLRLLLQAILTTVYRKPRAAMWRTTWRYGLVLALGLFHFGLMRYEVPTTVAFYFSESALRREAEAIIANPALVPATPPGVGHPRIAPRTIGLFSINSITYHADPPSVIFLVDDSGFFGERGWTYCPSGMPTFKEPWDDGGRWFNAYEDIFGGP